MYIQTSKHISKKVKELYELNILYIVDSLVYIKIF